jgi:hypothetical protein
VSRGESTFAIARRIALGLPGVDEGTSYGPPALRVRKKLFARLLEDGETLVVKADADARESLLQMHPNISFVTDHYAGHPMVLVRLAEIGSAHLAEVLESSWRHVAPKRLIEERDAKV